MNKGQERNQISNYQWDQELEKGKFIFNIQKSPDEEGLGKSCRVTKMGVGEMSPSYMNYRIRWRIPNCQIQFQIRSIESSHASLYYHNGFNLPLWLHFQRVRKPTAPGTMGQGKACKVEHSCTPFESGSLVVVEWGQAMEWGKAIWGGAEVP